LYFHIDQKKIEVHAIRQSAAGAVGWELLHLPLHASIIAVGASMADIVKNYVKDSSEPVDAGNNFSFAIG
jgi:low temperature requirement protein LtrA